MREVVSGGCLKMSCLLTCVQHGFPCGLLREVLFPSRVSGRFRMSHERWLGYGLRGTQVLSHNSGHIS